MLITENIKNTFKDIAKQSIHYHNRPDEARKYNKRILNIFLTKLTEDEQLYLMKMLFEHVHYKNIVTDPDNILMLYNIKLRTFIVGVISVGMLMVFAAALFRTNESLNNLIDIISNGFKLFSL